MIPPKSSPLSNFRGAHKEFWLHTFPALMLPVNSGEKQSRFRMGSSIVKKIKSKFKAIAAPAYRLVIQRVAADVFVKLQSENKEIIRNNIQSGISKLRYAGENICLPDDYDFIGHEFLSIGNDFNATRGLRLHCWKTETLDGLSSPTLEIGDRVFFNREAYVSCAQSIRIGNDTLFGSNILITDNYHGSTKTIVMRRLSSPLSCPGAVVIEDGVWVGNNVCILPGSRIGEGSIIGANSVVNSVIPAFCIAAGSPAKIIKYLAVDEL